MALQLALTTLESLAVMLNERKREAEQTAAFHAKLRSAGNKLGRAERPRVLLREDDVQLLEFNSWGQVSKKSRNCNSSHVTCPNGQCTRYYTEVCRWRAPSPADCCSSMTGWFAPPCRAGPARWSPVRPARGSGSTSSGPPASGRCEFVFNQNFTETLCVLG